MKRAFGHGFMQGRRRVAKQRLSQLLVFFGNRGFDLLGDRLRRMQDGPIPLVPFDRLPGPFDRRFMNNWHVYPPLEILAIDP